MTLFRTSSSTESAYAPLLQDEADSQDDVTLAEHDTQSKADHCEERGGLLRWRPSSLVYCACALSLLCSIFNLSLLALNLFSPHIRPSPPLEYASSYVGLEATVRDPSAPPLGPITTFPTGIGQVNESEPHAVYFDVHRWSSTFGMVYPEDRRILSSSTESTYIQFWAGDFGMERCSLKFMSPAEGGVLLSAPETTMRVWRVDVPRQ